MSTLAARNKRSDGLAQAEADAVGRIDRGELQPPVRINAPDGSAVSVIDREGSRVVVSREPRWRHGACPHCASPIVRVTTQSPGGAPFLSYYRCSIHTCEYDTRND